jgi:ABC-2 type transport system ATP-binding protein
LHVTSCICLFVGWIEYSSLSVCKYLGIFYPRKATLRPTQAASYHKVHFKSLCSDRFDSTRQQIANDMTILPTTNKIDEEIQVESLSVRFPGDVLALNNLSFNVQAGLFGLLGPNGAGKTTLIKVLTTLLRPTNGAMRIFGHDVVQQAKQIRAWLGYLPQDFQTYPQLKAWETLDYYGILNNQTNTRQRRQRIEEVLELVNLTEHRNRRVGKFSGGMLRRIGIAQAILNDAPVLIFDEPTAGLDPKERVHFRNFIGELSQDRIVILSTHIVADISSTCDRLAVLDQGQMKFIGARDELIKRAQGYVWRTMISSEEYESFRGRYTITGRVDRGTGIELRFLNGQQDDQSWERVEPNMEDAYLWITGGSHA